MSKKIQIFIYRSIMKQARRDVQGSSFKEFFEAFKQKNQHNWKNVMDLTEAPDEAILQEEERRNELVMLEEFRRRKNLEKYRQIVQERELDEGLFDKRHDPNLKDPQVMKEQSDGGPERFFGPDYGETFETEDFTLLFFESDSVCLITRLSRINHRRLLFFVGNEKGIIGIGKGKGIDY